MRVLQVNRNSPFKLGRELDISEEAMVEQVLGCNPGTEVLVQFAVYGPLSAILFTRTAEGVVVAPHFLVPVSLSNKRIVESAAHGMKYWEDGVKVIRSK